MSRRRPAILFAALLLALAALAWDRGWWGRLASRVLHGAHPGQPTVVFVVFDTTRADHLSLCGYGRPTTPTLERLRDRGASWTCGARSPGSWTLPSHASFFTGLDVPAHGAHSVERGMEIMRTTARPLGPGPTTLAESFVERGYQAAAISANPLVSRATGLLRGFSIERVAGSFGELRGRGFRAAVLRLLRERLDRDRPLFLFVNLSDAHGPLEGVDRSVRWLPERSPIVYTARQDGALSRYLVGEMPPSEVVTFLPHLFDVYDWGVSREDASLGWLLQALRDHGWFRAGWRVVVTSDHGEFLGEHRLLDHGMALWEPGVRVPLLAWSDRPLPPLADPVSGLVVHDLVLDGRLPHPLPAPESVAFPDPFWRRFSGGRVGAATWAAAWAGTEKLVWRDGTVERYDLAADPGEERPLPPRDGPLLSSLTRLAGRARAEAERPAPADREMLEALKAAGYVE